MSDLASLIESTQRPTFQRPVRPTPGDSMCRLHDQVPATRFCISCREPMCHTCDFDLGGGMHICPSCAMGSATQGLGPRRTRNVIIGYVLALVSTVTLALLMMGAFAPIIGGNEFAAGIIISLSTFVPAATGFGVASSACERHLRNNAVIWGAIIWNVVILVAFIALTVIGLAS